MCNSSTDPWEQTKKAANKVGRAAEKVRKGVVKGIETIGTHSPDPADPGLAAELDAEAAQIKAEQDATASANAMLQGKRRRKRAGAGLLAGGVDSVLASGALF